MIARLTGRLVRKAPDALVVDVGGVGYGVMVSLNTFCALPAEGAAVTLEVYTNVRENALELFGFADLTEKSLFTTLLMVSGVGPRVALNILSGIPSAELINALRSRDIGRLVAVPGVGKKTAERLVVELQDRVAALARAEATNGHGTADGVESEATSALINLGYRQPQAEQAVKDIVRAGVTDLPGVIRRALQRLST
jgi:Holliday junction DNA helicase RuvA